MNRPGLIFLILVLVIDSSYTQTMLDADGVSDTYDLINSVLAPGYDVIEAPGITVGDCDNHSAFGDHITQVFDDSLGIYVFAFHIHVDEDNDRCKNFDRQRCEIKTYDKSPDHLLGVLGETIEFKWKFKLDEGFQPSSSFTHIHQLKSVGSPEDGMPLITLTPRKGTPDKLQLRYAAQTSQSTIHEVELDPFKGVWVQATERVTYGEAGIGRYSLSLETVHDSTILMTYNTSSLRMWKTNADFIRPKWGIYRSLNDAASLRDEIVYFANFSIHEEEDTTAPTIVISLDENETTPVTEEFGITITFSEVVSGFDKTDITVENGLVVSGSLSSADHIIFTAMIEPTASDSVDISVNISAGVAQDLSGNDNEAADELIVPFIGNVSVHTQQERSLSIYPNPVTDMLHIRLGQSYHGLELSLIEQNGKVIYSNIYSGNSISLDVSGYDTGAYIVRLKTNTAVFYQNIIIR